MFKRWQRVRVKEERNGLSVLPCEQGRVVKTDKTRSKHGYDTLVVWRRKTPKASWVPSIYLESG